MKIMICKKSKPIQMKRLFLITTLVSLFFQQELFAVVGSSNAKKPSVPASYKDEAGDCRIPISQAVLDINAVRCRLLAAGDLWWDFDRAKYEVPKSGDGSAVGTHAIFAGAIWISGLDAAGNLKLAGQRFRQGTSDFYTGPLDNSGNITQATCNLWDKHFNVLGADISELQSKFGSGTITQSDVPQSILLWPGKGNPYLVSRGYDMNQNLAPFYDNDADGIYDPVKGDFPVIKNNTQSYADQMVFWVFNDKGNVHNETSSQPLGVQVNALAFAFATADEINSMTFYTYDIVNKSGSTINETYMSQFVDTDLGCYNDDRVGCDTSRSLGVVYNGRTTDPDGCGTGVSGYGTEVPMLGLDYFEGPIDTNGKELGLSSFNYFNNGASGPQTDPTSAAQYRGYMKGLWKDGSFFSYGGNAYGGSVPTKYCYPGDPSNATQWSECNQQTGAAIPYDDRRMLLTSGPFTFLPNASERITIGAVFVQPKGGTGLCPSFKSVIGPADDKAQALFNSGFKVIAGPDAPTLQIRELDKELIISLVNEKRYNNYGETYRQFDPAILTQTGYVPGMDSTYKFQGYKIYQLANESVQSSDLNDNIQDIDPNKAKLIGYYDVKDGTFSFINFKFEKDPILGILLPKFRTTKFTDSGIEHSFVVKTDAFNDNKDLINNRTYYFAAVAYATNNFKQFDATNPSAGGQQTQFLISRQNVKNYSAIPHKVESRNDGTVMNSKFGDAVAVNRIEGQGNGGNAINITKETIDRIMGSLSFKTDTLFYKTKFDPIGFKIIDPIALQEADFELSVKDTVPFNGFTFSDQAWWELQDITNNRVIQSERNMDVPYEQVISFDAPTEKINYGFSLSLGKPTPIYQNQFTNRPVYNFLSGNITYEDPNKKWLSFIADNGQAAASNWIRAGKYRLPKAATNPDPLAEVFDDNYYKNSGTDVLTDPDKIFEKIAGGTWAPYCLAANYNLVGNPANTATPVAVYGPGFKWDKFCQQIPPENTLDRLQSVDIVLTPDKSKWSQCIVFETGEQEGTNQGGDISKNGKPSRKGQIRMAFSKDKDGNTLYDPITGVEDTGRSWFPGYAINVETGQRLNIAFGEASEWGSQNGRDMIWNPTDQDYDVLDAGGTIPKLPYFGGKHFIYVMETPYDEGVAMRDTLLKYFDKISTNCNISYPTAYRDLYKQIMYTSIPYLTSGYKLNALADGLIPSEVAVSIRVATPFLPYTTNASGTSLPRYQFSTKGLGAKSEQKDVAKSALDLIRIVPNPYLAYSAYEKTGSDTRVKITNLPNNCSINIYSLDGTLIKTVKRSIDTKNPDPATGQLIEISDGAEVKKANLDNTAEWDLKNDKNVPVSSGVYLFEIDAPGIGTKVLKWFGAMRPTDISNF